MSNARIDAPRVIQTALQLIASIHLCVPWGEMRKVMGPGLSELKAAVAAQGIKPTGPWGEFEAWIVANGHKTGPDFWQCYVAGPESNADPSTWRTELNQPLIAAKGA